MNIDNKLSLPSFSVVMPCYNVENYVEEAIKSVLDFEYEGEVQIVIVDDGSTDGTWQRIQQVVEREGMGRNICTVKHKNNKGVAAATDTAYLHSTNDWLVKADADDIQMPNRLISYARLIRKYPGVCAIELACQRITEDGKPYEVIPFARIGKEISEYFQESPLQRYNGRLGIGGEPNFMDFGGTVAFKRNLYLKWGNLVEAEDSLSSRFADDTVWGTRYILSGPVAGANIISCLYRTRISGNLEYRGSGKGYSDIIRMEIETSKGAAYKAEAHRQAHICCLRALQEPSLSDWKGEHILQYAHKHEQFARYFALRHIWWEMSWLNRFVCYMANRNKLYTIHRGWCLKRLMPLWLVAFLRYIVLKSRR